MTTITLPRAVAEQALEALWRGVKLLNYRGGTVECLPLHDAITALRAAMAQQAEPVEPVAYIHRQGNHWEVSERHLDEDEKARGWTEEPLYTAPPQQAEPVEPVAWLRVIDEAMVTHHLGVADPGDDYETAKRKMNNLLCMAQDIGTYFAKQAEPVEPVACGDLEERKALSSVKLPCDVRIGHGTHRKGSSLLALVVRSRSLYQMAKSDAYGYASRLAVAIWEKHYKDTAPHWKPLDDLVGVLTQIDNMAAGMTRLAQQAEPAGTRALIEECLAAFAQELAAWDIDPPLHHVKQAHDKCEAWLAAPPQRKPLTEEDIEACRQQGYAHAGLRASFDFGQAARAVERAHGITDTQIADRLARHGIPMPEGDPK